MDEQMTGLGFSWYKQKWKDNSILENNRMMRPMIENSS